MQFFHFSVGDGFDSKVFLVLIPVFIIQLILMVVTLVDLKKRNKVALGNKMIWVFIIIFVNILGPIIYLVLRGDDE